MKSKKRNPFLRTAAALLLVLLMTLSAASAAWAADTENDPYDREDCSITLTLAYKDSGKSKNLVGGEISLYTVATVKEDNGYRFDVDAGKFAKSKGVSDIPSMDSKQLSKINSSLAKSLESDAAKVKADQTQKIENGQVSFEGLRPGLYLIVQTKLSDGERKVNSFLISIPNEKGEFQIKGDPKPGIYSPSEPKQPETKTTPKSGGKLPQTGQLWWPVPVLAGCGLLCILLGIFLRRKQELESV